MRNAKRGRGSRRGFYLCVVAALGFALCGCGGGGSGAASSSSSAADATSVAPPTGSSADVTLNWMPPTENTNGTALTNLAGYDIHYGTSSGDYTQKVSVSNPGIATYVVDNLTPGTYYFSVGAVNSQGVESPLSSEVAATVN
ncbi:MAG: fibronectin type III domain-containing protein [Steroidobacteraceae bacterium]